MRRLFSVLILSLFSLPTFAFANFDDVQSGTPHSSAINSLAEQNILEGYSDGTFKSAQDVTRAEALKIIMMGLSLEVKTYETSSFTDVNSGDWHFNIVESAHESGIVNGYSDDTFKPNQTINRAEATKMLLNQAGLSSSSGSEWYKSYMDYAVERNIVPIYADGSWDAGALVSRGEISEMIYRLQKFSQNGQAFDLDSEWTKTEFPTVDISLKIPQSWYNKADGVGAVWLLDNSNGQISLLDPYENGATILMTRYSNPEGESASSIFKEISANSKYSSSQTTINGRSALIINRDQDLHYKEWYIHLSSGKIVHFLALRGKGAHYKYTELMLNEIIASVEILANSGTGLSTDEIKSEIRSAIQVDGVGMSKINLLSDIELIETDTIGIGTGPVDYYYSKSANITIKYERSFDVILNVKDSKTTAF